MAQTKHELVIAHIEGLKIGEKVSVRQLARELSISDGTVYRAIKEAAAQGLVTSIPKVGTIRIENEKSRAIDSLSYQELALILEGRILCGEALKDQCPKLYYVALNPDSLKKRRSPATMIITGPDSAVIDAAVRKGHAVLITGDPMLSEKYLALVNQKQVLIMSTPLDIFDAISEINRTIFDRVTDRELITIGDIMSPDPYYLYSSDSVSDWYELSSKTGFKRFPIVDATHRLVGIASLSDVAAASPGTFLDDVMTPEPVSVHADDLSSYLARLLVWESMDIVPVVDASEELIGVVSRQDIIESLQSMQKQPQFGETIDNMVLSGFQLRDRDKSGDTVLTGVTTKFMLDEIGEVSLGNIAVLTSNAAIIAARMNEDRIVQPRQFNYQSFASIALDTQINMTVELRKIEAKLLQSTVTIDNEDGNILGVATMILFDAAK